MATLSPEQWIDLLVLKSAALRKAGILELKHGDLGAVIERDAPPPEQPLQEQRNGVPIDPLLDPHTYGLPEGARIPSLSHLEVIEDKDNR